LSVHRTNSWRRARSPDMLRITALLVLAMASCVQSAAVLRLPTAFGPKTMLRQSLRGGQEMQPCDDTRRLMEAVVSGELEQVKQQVDKQADLFWTNTTHAAGWTCLHEAIARGHVDIANLLIEKGGDGLILAQDEQSVTTLHVAAAEGMDSVVKALRGSMPKMLPGAHACMEPRSRST